MRLLVFTLFILACGSKDETVNTPQELPQVVSQVTTTEYCKRYIPYADVTVYERCMNTYGYRGQF